MGESSPHPKRKAQANASVSAGARIWDNLLAGPGRRSSWYIRDVVRFSRIFGLVVTLLAACDAEEVGPARAAVNGDVDDGSYPGVVGMFVNKPSGVARCTGVLLAPNLVLTARHCVAPTSGGFVDCGSSPLGEAVAGDQALSTTLGTMPPDDPSVYVAGSRIEVPPDGDDECGFDIAAVVLSRNLDGSEATPFPPRVDTPAMPGEVVTAVGFGSDGGGGGLGVRRVGGGLEVVCVGAADCGGGFVQDTELLVGDGVICQFDSGAPALDAEGRVIGVTSRGINPCDGPILSATFAWADWLRELGGDAATEGGYPTPAWAVRSEADAGPADGGEPDGTVADATAADAGPDGGGGGCAVGGSFAADVWSLFLLFLWGMRRFRPSYRRSDG
jgi:hypothetical protein